MKITMKACRYDAPSLAVLKIHFAKSLLNFFKHSETPPLPYLGSRLAFPVPPCANAVTSSSRATLAPNAIASSSTMALASAAGSSLNPIAVDEDESKGGFLGFIDLT